MHYLTKKYINQISNRLEKFHWKNNNLAVCRCPKCGDSKKNKRLARGTFFSYKGKDFYNCYNCGEPEGFDTFLYNFDRGSYREYKLEKFKDSTGYTAREDKPESDFETEVLKFKSKPRPVVEEEKDPLSLFKTFNELKVEHPARQYASSRNLDAFFDRIYYIPNFSKFAMDYPTLEKWEYVPKHPRMLFPCYSKDKELIGFSARAFTDDQVRYCTWKDVEWSLEHDTKVLYGLDRLDESETIYAIEGVVDSLFIDNSVAIMSAALASAESIADKENLILIPDNEPRAPVQVKNIKGLIDKGFKVTLWPSDFLYKDINEAISEGGLTKEDIKKIIDKNSYQGITANLMFSQWKKV
jgi:hypothetical protein